MLQEILRILNPNQPQEQPLIQVDSATGRPFFTDPATGNQVFVRITLDPLAAPQAGR